MNLSLGDILHMKKPHPCGSDRWQLLRVGADLRLRCLGCGHELLTPRGRIEKSVRSVEKSFDGAADKSAKNTGGK